MQTGAHLYVLESLSVQWTLKSLFLVVIQKIFCSTTTVIQDLSQSSFKGKIVCLHKVASLLYLEWLLPLNNQISNLPWQWHKNVQYNVAGSMGSNDFAERSNKVKQKPNFQTYDSIYPMYARDG